MTVGEKWDFASIEKKLALAEQNFDTLFSGFAWEQKVITFSFPLSEFPGMGQNVPEGEALIYTPFTQDEIDRTIAVFESIEQFVDLDFVYDPTGDGEVKIGHQNMVDAFAGYAAYPGEDSSHVLVVSDKKPINNPATQNDDFGLMTLIHEIGHSLGLEHTHEATEPLNVKLDTTYASAMSYNSVVINLPTFYANYAQTTFMPMDILALQAMYGVSTKVSDDVYIADNAIKTIADYGGFDTIDISTQTYDPKDINIVDLQRGFVYFDRLDGGWQSMTFDTPADEWSGLIDRSAANGFYNMMIMPGTTIEKVVGSAVRDRIIGTTGEQILSGGLGKDMLTGNGGADAFTFASAAEAGSGKACDTIKDFRPGTDQIDLSAIIPGGVFDLIGKQVFHSVAGELRTFMDDRRGTARDATYVQGDVDGDAVADFQIRLLGLHRLQDTDFVL